MLLKNILRNWKRETFYIMVLLLGVLALASGTALLFMALHYRTAEAPYIEIREELAQETPLGGKAAALRTRIDFEQLQKNFPDSVGWITVEGTPLDYPIMYAGDNETYLNRAADGSENSAGAIFLDCRNSPDFADENSIIFGHNLKSGSMFGMLPQYQNADYTREHPIITLTDRRGETAYTVFSVYVTTAGSESYTRGFSDHGDYLRFLQKVKELSLYDTGVSVDGGGKMVTLSTCTNLAQDERLVIQAISLD